MLTYKKFNLKKLLAGYLGKGNDIEYIGSTALVRIKKRFLKDVKLACNKNNYKILETNKEIGDDLMECIIKVSIKKQIIITGLVFIIFMFSIIYVLFYM
jgi:hypothetical protein